MLRELATRYGRDNAGFFWIILEPMMFTVGVIFMYRGIMGPYDRSINLVPFILTGYMPLVMIRHTVMYSMNAAKMNGQLLYHRAVSVLDLFMARTILEVIGVTLGFFIIFGMMLAVGLAPIPYDIGLMYQGWFIDALTGVGLAFMLGAISEIFEVVERIVGLAMYLLVPISGTLFLSDWLPESVRGLALSLPFLNCTEMIRAGLFGPSIHPHYYAGYTALVAMTMVVVGLMLVRQVRSHLDIA